MELGEQIGQGRQGAVYAYGSNRVVKLFNRQVPAGEIENERQISAILNEHQLPVAAFHGLMQHREGTGLIYERIAGRTLLSELLSDPYRADWVAETTANLQAAIHRCADRRLPDLRERLAWHIQTSDIEPDLKMKAVNVLDKLPDGDAICHGDFHPDNVILSPNGPVIIDWGGASRGHPAADFIRSALIMKVAKLPEWHGGSAVFATVRRRYCRRYVETYRKQWTDSEWTSVANWIAPVAIARLNDRIDFERRQLLLIIRRALRNL